MRNASLLTIGFLLMTAACSDKTAGSSGCTSNADCSGGQVCDSGNCIILCISDLDCSDGEVCDDSLCIPGARDNPTIDNIDGDGTVVCPDAGGSHCINTGIILTGTNLEGAQFNLAPQAGGTAVELFIRPESGDTLAALDLPVNVAAGTYVLTAVNQVGSADQALELLQGPPGPDLTANEMVTRINTASNTIALGVLPVGTTASDVAAGDHSHPHGHDASAIESGVIALARLPTGTSGSEVALGDHAHSGYLASAGGTITGDLTINGNLISGATTGSRTSVVGRSYVDGGAATAENVELNRLRVVASYAANAQRTVMVNHTELTALCGDLDGCQVTMGMRDYTGAGAGQVASRGPYRFYYNPASRYWRLSDTDASGRDNDGTTQHVMSPWSCYFTDGNYNISNLNDGSVGFSVMAWTGQGTNLKCELLIED